MGTPKKLRAFAAMPRDENIHEYEAALDGTGLTSASS
jgi:hypothetical protein